MMILKPKKTEVKQEPNKNEQANPQQQDPNKTSENKPQPEPQYTEQINSLVDMGYEKEKVEKAIKAANGSIDLAIEYLNGDEIPNPSQNQTGSNQGNNNNSNLPEELKKNASIIKCLCANEPEKLPSILNNLKEHSPQLFQLIKQNEEAFKNLLVSPLSEEDIRNYQSIQQELRRPPGQTIRLTKEGKEFRKKVKINLVDTGAQEKFQVITKRYFRWANAALLLYDITNKKTFDNLNHWLNFINKNINPNGYHKEYLIFLMGTKLDIVNQFPEKRQVKEEDAKEFCQNECLIWKGECSSKDFSDENYKKILSEIAQEEKGKIEKHKSKVEEELKEVMPEVEKAQSLVKKIDSGALAEITVYFRKPILPQEVYYILKATLQLIGYNDLSEYQVKTTFNMKAISSLQAFNIRKLSAQNADKINSIVNSNPNCFNKSNVERINLNLAKISEFIKAILKFYEVKLKIRPLEQALEEAEKKLDLSQKEVDKNTAEIDAIEKKVKEYEETYAKLTGEAEILKRELKSTEELLAKAESLFGKLKGEKGRWKQQIQDLVINNEMVPYNTLLSSAFMTFLGYYNESIRDKLYKEWTNAIDFGKHENHTCKLIEFLLKESEILKLKFDGLPTDTLSIENAIIINNSIRTVLLIDPVNKASKWFKETIAKKTNQFEVISLHDEKILTNIELAMRFGKTLLITDIDKIESFLIPLIRGDKYKRGPTNVMRLGEKVIEIHDNFKLYISTRDSSLEISNNVLCSMSVVNFTVTKSGLESILLGLTIDIEQPELEKQKNILLEEQDKIKLELKK